MKSESNRLRSILHRSMGGGLPDRGDIRFLLSLNDAESLAMVFRTAREIRRRHFGFDVFLYGFIYFSTFCQNDCRFCKYRRSNTALKRYRKTLDEILESARQMEKAGVHLIDLTMGEWPDRYRPRDAEPPSLVELARTIKARCRLPVMISPGVVSDDTLRALAAAGIDWYACYQETHNPRLFGQLRIGQDFAARMQKKRTARELGMRIEEGIMVGIGETPADVSDSIAAMRALDADQIRVMTFVPPDDTPMAVSAATPSVRESVVIAVLRLAMPDRLIPASLDVGGLAGLAQRLNAGANVVTSLVVPGMGLAGVANQVLDIEQARRTPAAIRPVLDQCGLRVAEPGAYRDWIDRRTPRPTTNNISPSSR